MNFIKCNVNDSKGGFFNAVLVISGTSYIEDYFEGTGYTMNENFHEKYPDQYVVELYMTKKEFNSIIKKRFMIFNKDDEKGE